MRKLDNYIVFWVEFQHLHSVEIIRFNPKKIVTKSMMTTGIAAGTITTISRKTVAAPVTNWLDFHFPFTLYRLTEYWLSVK